MYSSTRSSEKQVSAKEAILQGLAPDGGLFVMPDLASCKVDLEMVARLDFRDIAKLVYLKLLDDFTENEIDESINSAYSNTFEDDIIAPVVKVGNHYIMELWHGPTSAFKDVALTILPHLLSKSLEKTGKKVLILTATSGDTGKAAMSGFADVKNTGICVYYPHGGVSPIQERQMRTQVGDNVDIFAIEGNFDDAQRGVKQLFLNDELDEYANQNNIILSSANSINIGRLIPQIIYYFSSYADLVKLGEVKIGDTVTYTVPTGNFGDVLAGYYAQVMGLPAKFIVAANKNNVLDDFIKTGVYDRNRKFYKTISPSMDILVTSNLERLLYYITNCNTDKVSDWMQKLSEFGKYKIDDATYNRLTGLFSSGMTDEEGTMNTIRQVYEAHNYVLDTHSAVAYNVAENSQIEGASIVLSTASPYKFPQAVMKALGQDITDEWKALDELSKVDINPCPKPLANLTNAPVLHNNVIKQDDMIGSVKRAVDKIAKS